MSPGAVPAFCVALACLVLQASGQPPSPDESSDVSALISTPGQVLISEFYPCALEDDEYLVLFNAWDAPVPLAGWHVTDGEGLIEFREGASIAPRSRLALSFNGSSFAAAYGVRPTIDLDEPSSDGLCEMMGMFKLGNDGDSLVLMDRDGVVSDSAKYGACTDDVPRWLGPPVPAPRMGEVFKRMPSGDALEDTDSSADWMPFREHRYGYTSHDTCSSEVAAGNMTLFTSPDCTSDVLRTALGSANHTLRVCSYEFSSPLVCDALIAALARGVDVRLLVDGCPSGGIDDRGIKALSLLASLGASVRVLAGSIDDDVVRHVSALHSKYVVVDGETVIVMSENLVPSGVPVDHVFGNRGWGFAARDAVLGAFLASVFDDDCREGRPDVFDWLDDDRYDPLAGALRCEATAHPVGLLSPLETESSARVTLAVSPDASIAEPFLRGLVTPERSLMVEQFQVDLLWSSRWTDHEALNPLLADVIHVARSGVASRFLTDSSWFNIERNGEVVDALTAVYSAEALDSRARMISSSSPVTVLHNKGLIVDARTTVVSSNNWVYASFARNRELAAIIDSEEVAGYFAGAFDADWYPDVVDPVISVPVEVYAPSGSWIDLSSRECTDDRMLVDVSWDVDGDGASDARTPTLSLLLVAPGDIVVTLTVTDSWGNEATQRITVHVVGDKYWDPGLPPPRGVIPSVAAGLLAIAMTSVWLVRRRGSFRR
jgi:cardiolipin synthase